VQLGEGAGGPGAGADGAAAQPSPRPRREIWRVTPEAAVVGSLGQYSSLSSSNGSMADLGAAVDYGQLPADDQEQRKVVVLG
jgi:hypothetical protein